MGEMHKTSPAYCGKCKYSYGGGYFNTICDRYLVLGIGNRRGCPVGWCDKFEPKTKKYKAKGILYKKRINK